MRRSIALLQRALRPLLIFAAGSELAILLLLDPLLLLLVSRIVALGGDPFVGNAALIGFVLSPPGLVAIVVASVGVIFAGVVASAGASVILWEARGHRPARSLAVWWIVLRRVPALLALSAAALAAALLLALPVLATAWAAGRAWLTDGDFYFYLTTRPPEFMLAAGAVGIVAAAAGLAGLILLLRTGLSVPICMLQPVGPWRAIGMAAAATRGRTRAVMPRLLAVAVAMAVLWAGGFALLYALSEWLIGRPMSETALARAGLAVTAGAAVAAAMLAAITRSAVLLVLLQDRAAAACLPARVAAEPGPARHRWAGAAATLAVCAAIALVPMGQMAFGGATAARAIGVTAHRAGSARAPENTFAALENAIAERADVVEIDAQETADGQIVLLHDTDLRRVAGVARPIWEMRADEVQRLDVGSWFAPRFAAERIPTLRAFAEASRGRVRLNVELKENGHGADLAARTVAILRETGTADRAAISSLELGLLRQVRALAPEIKVGLILATGIGNLRAVDVDFLALARRLATPAVIDQLAARGRDVHVWTLDDDPSIVGAMLDGADNIITGDTRLAVGLRDWFVGLTPAEKAMRRIVHSFGVPWLRFAADGAARQGDPADP